MSRSRSEYKGFEISVLCTGYDNGWLCSWQVERLPKREINGLFSSEESGKEAALKQAEKIVDELISNGEVPPDRG